ncbi:hypothetical protein D3C78_1606990 [compost metagenome]
MALDTYTLQMLVQCILTGNLCIWLFTQRHSRAARVNAPVVENMRNMNDLIGPDLFDAAQRQVVVL